MQDKLRTDRISAFKDLDNKPGPQTKDEPQFIEVNRLWHGRALAIVERQIIEFALKKFRGRVTHAAEFLGVSPRTLYNRGFTSRARDASLP